MAGHIRVKQNKAVSKNRGSSNTPHDSFRHQNSHRHRTTIPNGSNERARHKTEGMHTPDIATHVIRRPDFVRRIDEKMNSPAFDGARLRSSERLIYMIR